jgi:predicted RNA-binding protein (virulence factor B family)
MADIGKFNTLRIVKFTDFGAYLDGGELGEILLPRRYVRGDLRAGDRVEVFLYLDSEDRLVATTEKPLALVGEFAYLKVNAVNNIGAFLDWGLSKDLLVPFREQRPPMAEGRSYFVFLYLDGASRRIVASARLNKFIDPAPPAYAEGQEVDLLIVKRTELGFSAIINNSHWGVLYENEIFQDLHIGQRVKGYVKKVREDQKIDLRLQQSGYRKVTDLTETILNALRDNGGFLEITDHSAPEKIHALFGTSKKAFKMAVGALYKKRLIALEDKGLRLIEENSRPG